MKAINHFFKTLDTYLNKCVDYFDYRIRTGKFIGDIAYQLNRVLSFVNKEGKKGYGSMVQNKIFFELISLLKTLWQLLMKIPLLKTIVFLLTDTIKILITCYSEIFIVFALTFPTSILLLNWFQTSIVTFLIAFIPIMLIDIFCVSALYYCIDRRETGDKISIWKSFLVSFRHFFYFSFPIVTEYALLLETLLVFFIVSIFVSDIFTVLQISWSGSIFFWFIIVFLGSLVFIEFFVLTLIMYQTYFLVLLEHMPLQQAVMRSRMFFKTFLGYDLFFFILFYLFCILLIWKAALSLLYFGVTIGIFFTIAIGTFLAFLFYRRFRLKESLQEPDLKINHKTHIIFIIIVIFGLINYILAAVLFVKEYQPILAFVQKQQDNFLASQEEKLYFNNAYGYSIKYPQSWSVYQWNNKSVTFYNNYTGTITGGTWMTINVSSFNPTAFNPLYSATAGIVIYDPQTKNITTKITDMTIQGYPSVNYTFIKSGEPYSQYETHYLIRRGNIMYDIAFISLANDVANYNNDLFQKIIDSLKFID